MKEKISSFFSDWFEEEPEKKNLQKTNETSDQETDSQQPVRQNVETTTDNEKSTFTMSAVQNLNEVDKKYMEKLQEVLEKANIPGVDYMEFGEAVRINLKKGKSQKDAFVDAYDNLCVADKKLNVTVLRQTAKQYVDIIEETKDSFVAECNEIIRETKENANEQLVAGKKKLDDLKSEKRQIELRLEQIQNECKAAEEEQSKFENSIEEVVQAQGVRIAKMNNAAGKAETIIKADDELIVRYLVTK